MNMAQREIKFRMWDKPNRTMRPVKELHFGDDGSGRTVLVDTPGRYYSPCVDGESCVLLQYTGLKDRDGTDIYEGDIIDAWSQGSHQVGVTTWGLIGFYIKILPPVCSWHFSGGYEPCKVIGNIYEHPHLVHESLLPS